MSSDAIIQRFCRIFDVFCCKEKDTKEPNKRYLILRVLGSGATGLVFLAKRLSDGKSFAVKAVELEGMSEADRGRAEAEVHCLVRCDFFSIITCHEDFIKKDPNHPDHSTTIALVLDYANAGDLHEEIKSRAKAKRPFQEHEAGLVFIQVLMAIHHVHGKHMLHRDIKSANILLCSSGLIKLGDFGFSKMYQASVSEAVGKTFLGTPYYVAPEIWKRLPYSKKADMFALGVLLYELLTLKRPFDGPTMLDVMDKTLAGTYDPLPEGTSPEMRLIVTSLLHSDPDQRISSFDLLEMPICKLFVSGLTEVVQTQNTLTTDEKAGLAAQIAVVRARSIPTPQSADNPSADVSTTKAPTVCDAVLFEGLIKKQSGDGVWKTRYLCIRSQPQLELILSITKSSMEQQAIVMPFADLEDVFHMPPKYTGANALNVFAVAFKTGTRQSFQAPCVDTMNLWMKEIQKALGI